MATAPAATPNSEKLVKTFNDTNYFAQGTYKRDFVELFSTATIANLATKTILAPLQRWRIIKQTQLAYELRPVKMSSFAQYLTKVYKEQGFKAFWRGNGANLWLHGWQVLTQITLFDTIKSTFNEFAFEMNDPVSKFLLERVAAPLVASACTLAITHPIDTARIRLSMNYFRNPKEMLFHGVTSCWSLIRLEEKSIRGLYRGYLMANIIAMLHLNIYVTARDLYQRFKVQDNQIVDLLASKESIGALVALMLLHPLDTLKKNLQLNNQGKPIFFSNSLQVLYYLKTNGDGRIKVYQGLTASVVRHLLYCPIFALSLSFLDQNVKIF